ncbi:MAG: DNA internalization-related competence protein ComEC/Rec2 [Caldilineaceae bacterium]
MTILYLTIIYILGVACGWWLWDASWFGCDFPSWAWCISFGLLPVTPLINRIWRLFPNTQPLRWSQRFGFRPPRYGPSPGLLAALLLCFVTGVLRYATNPFTPCWDVNDLAYYNLPTEAAFDKQATKVLMQGSVSSYPLLADRLQKSTVQVTSILIDGVEHPVSGEAQMSVRMRQKLAYGQPVVIRGRLVTPNEFDSFSYRDYLARRGVHSVVYDAKIEILNGPNVGNPIKRWLYLFRSRGEALLNRLLPEPYAALANGMLLGIDAGIPDELYDKFNATGSSHVIVISGSNVALISMVFLALGKRIFGKRHAIWATLIAIAAYSLLVGGDPAVLRASLMGGLVVVASTLGRRSTALVSLATACWVMTLVNPLTVWDVGFQLSSSATAGLILFTPSVEGFFARLFRSKSTTEQQPSEARPEKLQEEQPKSFLVRIKDFFVGLFSEALIATLAANISTLPMVVYYFGRLSIVSILTNLLVVPVQPPILFAGSAGVLIGVAGFESVAWFLLKIAQGVLWWTVTIVTWTASFPNASIGITAYTGGELVLTYLLISLLRWRGTLIQAWRQWIGRDRTYWQVRLTGSLATGALSIAMLSLWFISSNLPDHRLHLYFLDIGQGDGILIETPSGRQVLIDGGKEYDRLIHQLNKVLPWWDRSLDLVVLTHPDGDHMWAQEQLPLQYEIAKALITPITQASVDAEKWIEAMNKARTTVDLQQEGGKIDLGDGVILQVLWPPAGGFDPAEAQTDDHVDTSYDNENGLVLRLEYGSFSSLFTADIGAPSEAALLERHSPLNATLLKVGHHGSKFSSSEPFIEAVNPQVAVIQVGQDNDYGHPHAATLQRLKGRPILRTDIQGAIEVTSDGEQMWLKVERNQTPVKRP